MDLMFINQYTDVATFNTPLLVSLADKYKAAGVQVSDDDIYFLCKNKYTKEWEWCLLTDLLNNIKPAPSLSIV